MVLALILAGAIGLALGVLGGGGSIITVPVLVYAAGQTPQDAVPMSLAIVGAVSALGTLTKRATASSTGRPSARLAVPECWARPWARKAPGSFRQMFCFCCLRF